MMMHGSNGFYACLGQNILNFGLESVFKTAVCFLDSLSPSNLKVSVNFHRYHICEFFHASSDFLEFVTPYHHMDVFRRHVHSIKNFAQELVVLEIVF